MVKNLLFLFLLQLSVIVLGQEITLDKIYSGRYATNSIRGIKSMKDGEHYTILEESGVVKYSYKTGEKIGVIIEGRYIDYRFSDDEKKILLLKSDIPIYRHSFLGEYEVVDLEKNKRIKINEGKSVQEPKLSPNGREIAFIYENNIFHQNLDNNTITQITSDGEKNSIINGLADWVYEEEFGHADMYQWAKNGQDLIFIKFDESNVKEMNMQMFGTQLYPYDFKFKYPKAGEENSKVSVYTYNINTKKQKRINIDNFENYYIPHVFHTNDKDEVVVVTTNRHQNRVELIKINTKTFLAKKILTETDTAWVEVDNLILDFLPDNSFLWASERDGYRHIYWYSADGRLKKQITKGAWEITDYYGFNPKTKEIFIQTTQNGVSNRSISKVNISSLKQKLIADKKGHNTAEFSQSFKYFINMYSSAEVPPMYVLNDIDGKFIRELENNNQILEKLKKDNFANKEFFYITNENGDKMEAYMIKPKNFDPNKKYPVLMYQYSGPGSQQVSNKWDSGNTMWFNLLAQKGYIVAVVDGRGTGYKGVKYKKSTYKNLGKYELEDQIYAAKWLGAQPYIDRDRIGIFGWSFGGYISTLAMTKGADVFRMGIAVAPVTTWRYYDTIYTERFLQTPQENPKGYDENSPINFAHLMKGKYLLIHGTADDNVHYQNALEMANALIKEGIEFDFMTYPDKNHGIYGGKTRYHLYNKMTQFILDNL